MRNILAAAVIGVVALSGQAIANETTKASTTAVRTVAAKSATNQQVLGLSLAQTLLLAAGIITVAVIVADGDDDNKGGVITSP